MPSDGLRKALGRHPQTAQVVALLGAGLTIQLSRRFTHSQTCQSRPIRLLFHIVGGINLPVLPRLYATVVTVYGFVPADLIAEAAPIDDGIEEDLDFLLEVGVIAFQRQHII